MNWLRELMPGTADANIWALILLPVVLAIYWISNAKKPSPPEEPSSSTEHWSAEESDVRGDTFDARRID